MRNENNRLEIVIGALVNHDFSAHRVWTELEAEFHPGCPVGELRLSAKKLAKLEDVSVVRGDGRVYLLCPQPLHGQQA
jgi:ribosomal protein L36